MARPDIEKIKKLLDRTTEGAWEYDEYHYILAANKQPLFTAETPNLSDAWVEFKRESDAYFLADSKQIVNELLTYIEELEKPVTDEWTISERLSINELKRKLSALDDKYAGNLVHHKKTGDTYYVCGFTVLNANGTAEVAVEYEPMMEDGTFYFRKFNFVRPAREFFDGRFEGAIFNEEVD